MSITWILAILLIISIIVIFLLVGIISKMRKGNNNISNTPVYVHFLQQGYTGGNLLYRPDLVGQEQQLEYLCNETRGCSGFTSDGYLKKRGTYSLSPSSSDFYYKV